MTDAISKLVARALQSADGVSYWHDAAHIVKAIYSAGLQVVPVAPTKAMLEAAYEANGCQNDDMDNIDIYKAMLTAAAKEAK